MKRNKVSVTCCRAVLPMQLICFPGIKLLASSLVPKRMLRPLKVTYTNKKAVTQHCSQAHTQLKVELQLPGIVSSMGGDNTYITHMWQVVGMLEEVGFQQGTPLAARKVLAFAPDVLPLKLDSERQVRAVLMGLVQVCINSSHWPLRQQ